MIDVVAYQERIGYRGPLEPTLPVLRALHLAHLRAVPFENLDIHLGRPIVLDERRLFDKIVRRRRGGFCDELNGLFAALLREIGFAVTLLGAQYPRDDGTPTPELDHLTLLVRCEKRDEPLLADVGAGRTSFAYPLSTGVAQEQAQPDVGATSRLLPERDACRLWRREPGAAWEREYRFTWRLRHLADLAEGCHFHQTSPHSHFPRKRLATLLTPEGRVTLSELRLITTVAGTRTERELPDEATVQAALRTMFDLDLDP